MNEGTITAVALPRGRLRPPLTAVCRPTRRRSPLFHPLPPSRNRELAIPLKSERVQLRQLRKGSYGKAFPRPFWRNGIEIVDCRKFEKASSHRATWALLLPDRQNRA